MKKILSSFIIVIFLVIANIANVLAKEDLVQKLKIEETEVKAGDEVIVTLSLENNISKIDTYSAQLSYDKELFEEIEESNFISLGNWKDIRYNKQNSKFILINSIGSFEEENILKIKFIAKKDVTLKETSISIGNTKTSSGNKDVILSDEQVDIEIKPTISESQGNNSSTNGNSNNVVSQGNNSGTNGNSSNVVSQGNNSGTNGNSSNVVSQGNNGDSNGNSSNVVSQGNNGDSNGDSNNSESQGNNSESSESLHSVELEKNNNEDAVKKKGKSFHWVYLIFIGFLILIIIVILLIKNKKLTKGNFKNLFIFLFIVCVGSMTSKIFAANGEITGDHKVNYDDIYLLEEYLIELSDIKEEYLKNADLNHDDEITITDLSLLLKLVEQNIEYKADISSSMSEYYYESNEPIDFKFNADIKPYGKIESVMVNGKEYEVIQVNDTNQYIVKFDGYDKAGVYQLNFTKIKLFGEKEIKVNFTQEIEVLKSSLKVSDFKVNNTNSKVDVFFKIIDADNAFLSGKAQLLTKDGSLQEFDLKQGDNNLSFNIQEEVEYTFKIVATYNKTQDGSKKIENDELLMQKLHYVGDYNINITNLHAYNMNDNLITYMDKNAKFKIKFEAISTKSTPKKAIINAKEYLLNSLGNNVYEVVMDGFDSAGLQTLTIKKVILENTKEIDITKNNVVNVEVLKSKPTLNNFGYKELENGKIKVNFDVIDQDNSIKSSNIIINDGDKDIFTKNNITVGTNEIEFPFTGENKYDIKLIANYDLDSNTLSTDDNEYTENIFHDVISVNNELIEFKDIVSIKLFKNDNNQIVEVDKVDVSQFNPKDYLVQLYMKDLPQLYATIKETRVENGKFIITLDYDNTIQYGDSNAQKYVEVVYGNVDSNYISSKSDAKVLDQRDDLYIPNKEMLSKMKDYDQNKEVAYHNVYKLMPFYNSKLIVSYGNKISENNILNKSKIKMIIPYNKDGVMLAGLNSNNYNDIVKLKIVFENEQSQDYTVQFDKTLSDVAVYTIDEFNIKYNYNQYVLNTDNTIVQTIIDKAKGLDYTTQISTVTPETESRLYVDYYNDSVKDRIDQVMINILANIPEYNVYMDNDILKSKIERDITENQQLEKLIYTYNYFDKWYNMNIGGASLSDLIFFKVNSLNHHQSILGLVKETIATANTTRETTNTVNFFNSVIKDELENKDLGSFIEYFMKVLGGYEDGSAWFADNFKGLLKELSTLDNKDAVRYKAWEHLKFKSNLLLPVLSAPQEDMYIISIPSQLIIGSLNRYTSDRVSLEKSMQNYAVLLGNFYKTSASFISNSEKILNSKTQIQFDTRFNFPNGLGHQVKGTTEDPVIKWVYEAVNAFAPDSMLTSGAGAYADGNNVFWVKDSVLGSSYPFNVFSHETAHNQDGYYFYEGYGRRTGTGPEDHADGNITQSALSDGSLVFNISRNDAITSDKISNLTMDRITGKENIHSYYKEMFEASYVLDYLTAKAFLKLTPYEQSQIAVQAYYKNGSDLETGGGTIIYYRRTEADFKNMNLQTVEDLWDKGIVLRKSGEYTDQGNYGEDDFYSVYWYQPHNNNGRPDSYTFKRLGFEMLGIGGYSDGYVTYRSGKSTNDLDALRKITGNSTITWKEYKLNRYKEIESKLDSIKYFNAEDAIDAYYEALKEDAQVINSTTNTNNVRKTLYGIMKRATKDFSTGSIYQSNEEIEISNAQQFIEILSNNEWGNYVLTDDLDFSGISVTQSYVNKTFVGKINGNGHKIKGVSKPLFNEVIYGELQNIIIEDHHYDKDTPSIVAITSKNMVISDVIVNNMTMNLPFAKNIKGKDLQLGTTKVNISGNVIDNLDDFLKIGTDEATRKMSYTLTADIDLSSVTGSDAIISGIFTGTIDGNGHKVYNLNKPLFNNLQGSIKNLHIENMNYTVTNASYVGALAKQASQATIENIYINKITVNSAKEYVGGLLGRATNTTINNVNVEGLQITATTAGIYTGGLIGRSAQGNVSNISVKGDMTIYATHNGGLIGAIQAPNGRFENIFVNVNISRPNNSDSRNKNGGIFGEIENFQTGIGSASKNPVFKNVVSIGNIASDVYKVGGGFSGRVEGELVLNSTNNINVYESKESTGKPNVGGGSNVKEISLTTLQTESFYIDTLGWSKDIWDFSDMNTGPKLRNLINN